MATRYLINIDNLQNGSELLVCRCVLEGLEGWLRKDGHEKVLPAIATLREALLSVRNEFYAMRDQGELEFFRRSQFIKSAGGIIGSIEKAYTYAYAAGVEHDNGNSLLASENIHSCHTAIKKTIGEILISVKP